MHWVDFAASAYKRLKRKKKNEIDRYLGLIRELMKLWKRKVRLVQVVVCSLGTVTKGLEKRLGIWRSEEESRQFKKQYR